MAQFLYAAFVAHRGPLADYSMFDGQLFRGRSYRQPLVNVPAEPAPNTFAPGLELYLHATAAHPEIPRLYAWTGGALTWRSGAGPARVGQLTLVASTTDSALLNTFGQVERAPRRGVYDNVDTDSVLDVFGDFLRERYNEAKPAGTPRKDWHLTLRETQVEITRNGKVTRQNLKEYLDDQYKVYQPPPGDSTRDPEEPVRKLMRRFTAEPFPDGPTVDTLLVNAGDPIGAAAAPPSDDLPGPGLVELLLPFWLRTSEARRVRLELYDPSDQPLNPLYSLYQLFGEPTVRARSVTDGFQRNGHHPLVPLYDELNAEAPPRAREQIDGVSILPIGKLSEDHGFPPSSTYVWHYADSGALVATPMPVNAQPNPRIPNAELDAIREFWQRPYNNPAAPAVTTLGQAIGIIADALQVPCEIIVATAGAESSFQDRVMRLEPLPQAVITQNPDVAKLYGELRKVQRLTHLVAGDTGPTQPVHQGNALTWGQLNDLITRTGGQKFSPGIMQTLLGTAREALEWARIRLGGTRFNRLLGDLGLDALPTDLVGYVEWLFNAPQAILAGTAYLRKRYNVSTTRFDLPLVAGVYNSGGLSHANGAWGVVATSGHIDNETKFYNAAIRFFTALPPLLPPVPAPIVRLGR